MAHTQTRRGGQTQARNEGFETTAKAGRALADHRVGRHRGTDRLLRDVLHRVDRPREAPLYCPHHRGTRGRIR